MLLQNSEAFKSMHKILSTGKEATYRVLDCGEGYWFIGYVDFSLVGQDSLTVRTEFVDCTYRAIENLSPSTFPQAESLKKFLDYRESYNEFAMGYLAGKDSNFIKEEASENLFNRYLEKKNVKIDDNDFKL